MLCSLFALLCPQVDAYFYPDRSNLTEHIEFLDVGSVEDCRQIVFAAAAERGDPEMQRGDYECGIDPRSSFGSLKVYKETVR